MAEPDDRLRKSIDELVELLRDLRAKDQEVRVYSTKKDKQKSRPQPGAAIKLRKLLKQLEETAPAPPAPPGGAEAAAGVVAAKPNGPEPQADIADEEKMSIDRFFSEIAGGVLTAQAQLDRRSEQYLADTAHKPYLPPTVFRIPKVTGEIKFGLSKEKEQGFNFLFFKGGRKHEQFQEHSLRFEIVSAPPALEAVRELHNLALGVRFLIAPVSRAPIVAAVDRAVVQSSTAGAKKETLLKTLRETPQKVVVMEPSAGPSAYLIGIYAEGAEHLFVWLLEQPDAGDPAVACVLKVPTSDPGVPRLAQELQKVFERQRQIIDGFEQLSPPVNA